MSYPTDPLILSRLTDEEWNTLLASVWSAPLPRKVVRLVPLTDDGKVAPGERKALILERMAKGEKQAAIARDLGLSPSLINKILKGVRQ